MSGPWSIGQRVRYEDTEDPRPRKEQMRGTVVGMVIYEDENGRTLDGVHVHWDGDDDPDDIISVHDASYVGLKSDERFPV